MGSLEKLTDDQRAVLQMLLRRDNSYEDLAILMKTDLADIRRQAREAIAAVGPDASEIGQQRRDEIADFLLGQQTVSRFEATQEYLRGSDAGRAWATETAAALGPIDSGTLPEIPSGAAASPPAVAEQAAGAPEAQTAPVDAAPTEPETASPPSRSPQLGNRLIVAGVAVVLIVIVLVIVLGGGGKDKNKTASTVTKTSTTGTLTTPKGDQYNVVAAATLLPPKGVDSTAKGNAAIFQFPATGQYRIGLQATGLPPSSARGSAYGVWLYSTATKNRFLGFSPNKVGKSGRLQTVSDLAPDTPNYGAVLLTRETAAHPTKPGTIILVGQMVTAAPSQPKSGTTTAPATTTPQTTKTTP
jgi:hypothetical protein